MRLGLSATPESYTNPDATARLKAYYGDVVSEFSLADALQADVITSYDYHVSEVELSEVEAQAYLELSEQIAVLSSAGGGLDEDSTDDIRLKTLLMKRARIIGSAVEKIDALENALAARQPQPLTLFYCGDGSTEDEDTGDSIRQIDRVCEILYEKGWKCARFTARESREEREALLNAFKIGAIDALVAIRCLDEGIDVPACRTAYILASSRNPKQFIQRRGRILRRSAGKTSATIYDFLVRLPLPEGKANQTERNLVRSELARVAEFANLARNARDAAGVLLPLLKEYDLAHLLV
jgi:superfamily II DNA or RNA helicase